MKPLREIIQADADKRLALPDGKHPSDEAARYKRFLKFESQRIRLLHRGGGGGREVCQARAAVIDSLLDHLLTVLDRLAPARTDKGARCAVVAVGGYGRGELNPCSDIDVIFLLDREQSISVDPAPQLELITRGLIFDIDLKVGYAVRTIADCVEVAGKDMQSKTALLEARCIWGPKALFEKMRTTVIARCVKGHEDAYIEARLADQAERRTKHGNSPCMQEPNIKNGCGGLRDFQNLLWMAFVKYRTRGLADLEARELVTAEDRAQLDSAYDFLLRVRTELHYLTGRPTDVLTRAQQPAVAHGLGYHERSLSARIERFMRDYYRHSRAIHLITRTLEQRLALLPQPRALPTLRRFLRQRRHNAAYAIDGFKFVDGQIHAAREDVFDEDPARLLRVFRHAQRRGLTLSPDVQQAIRRRLKRVDEKFRADPHAHETFLALLNERGNVAHYVRTMHEVGLLGRFLPPFEKLTCRVQHEFYHVFAADEHTLVCLEMLDRVSGATEPPFNAFTEIYKKIERPDVLNLALLLHDVGKGQGGDHAEVGSRIGRSVARRLGLDPAATETLQFVILHHLTLINIATRRDLEDPSEIRAFARQVGTIERLNLLTLVTFADCMGTTEKLWSGHRQSLVWSLYRATHRLLSGPDADSEAAHQAAARVEFAAGVRKALAEDIEADEVDAHLAHLPPRQYAARPPADVAADIRLVHRFLAAQLDADADALAPVTEWVHDRDRGYSQLRLCTWDRRGLFGRIAGVLTAARLNILHADILTRRTDDVALDTFLVADAANGAPATTSQQQDADRWLAEILTGRLPESQLVGPQARAAAAATRPFADRLPTRIRFDNLTSHDRTTIEVETEDHVGLLHAMAQALAELGISIVFAKISTDRGSAVDTFYVVDHTGRPLLDPARQQQVERRLKAAIRGLA